MQGMTWDAAVIGSGLGGLTAAALLASRGRSVCVIERNHSVGGAASIFRSGALTIEPSLHQTADPRHPNDPRHAVLGELGLLDEIEWLPVHPFFRTRGGPVGEAFDLPVGFDAAEAALISRFPRSRSGIHRTLGSMRTLTRGVAHLNEAGQQRSLRKLVGSAIELRSLVANWRMSLDESLQRTLGDDEAAKCALAGNLAYYADDPRTLSWPFFAIAQGGYLDAGGVYVKGGSRALSAKLARIVIRAGGVVKLGREVTEVQIDGDGRPHAIVHVDARDRSGAERLAVRQVFANCAPDALAAMLPEPERGRLQETYAGRALSTSLFSAHFGLKRNPAEIGMTRYGEVVLPPEMNKLSDIAQSAYMFGDEPKGELPIYGVTNYGAIDNGLDPGGLSLVSVAGIDRLDNWNGLTREQERARRERWLDAFQEALERSYPGFAALTAERVFLSARSMQGFLHTPGGAIYGFAPEPPRRGVWAGVPRSVLTPMPDIFLASSFAGSGGFTGAMLAGADAARRAVG
jgi:phytoene dehydrogenase-like protein